MKERLSDFDLALLQQEFEEPPPKLDDAPGKPGKPGKPDLPDPYDMASQQAEDAIARGRVDLSNAPHWRWPTLDERLGRMMPGQLVIVGALSGNGKALALDTPLPTPAGWTTMGEIRVGDELIDEAGRPCRVTYATSIQRDRVCYEVCFTDGTRVVADADHLWWTRHSGEAAPRTSTTADVRAALSRARGHDIYVPGDGRAPGHVIADVRPVASVPVRCVQVDSPSRLYLCSRAMIPTHNSSFMMSQMDWAAAQGIGQLYVPLELNPEDLRRQWAAWRVGLDWQHVARNEWDQLPAGSQELHEMELARLAQSQHIQFPPERRIDIPDLARWVEWGVKHFQARCIIIDHFHRMDFGGSPNTYRIQVSDAARALKDLAREFKVTVVATAQLNRLSPPSLLDRYVPPGIDRLKESSALAEEADIVLMLSRRLRKGAHSKADLDAVRSGHKSERDMAEPDVMVVTCRKHRLSDAAAGDRSTMLRVVGGHVVESRTD
jgi:replicative DNA helicase